MANFIISGGFADIYDAATISSRTENASYPDDNIAEWWHLKKHFRAADATKNDWLLKVDFGSAQALDALLLNDVNFDEVTIQGHASDSWVSPSYDTTFDINEDTRVQRYKAYLALTSFNYRWLRIFIESTANKVGDLAVWAVGTIVPLLTGTDYTITLSPNIAYGYEYTAEKPVQDNKKKGGSKERIGLGENLIWRGEIPMGIRTTTDESQLWALNALDIAEPCVLFENEGNTQYAYLCLRDDHVRMSRETNNIIQIEPIAFTEIV